MVPITKARQWQSDTNTAKSVSGLFIVLWHQVFRDPHHPTIRVGNDGCVSSGPDQSILIIVSSIAMMMMGIRQFLYEMPRPTKLHTVCKMFNDNLNASEATRSINININRTEHPQSGGESFYLFVKTTFR